jgi:S1-C subfamily serine protease
VTADSPAAQAGLKEGDIITAINEKPVSDLRAYAAMLRALTPGDTIVVDYRRGTDQNRVSARVSTR